LPPSSGLNPLSSQSPLLKYMTSMTYKDTVHKLKLKVVPTCLLLFQIIYSNLFGLLRDLIKSWITRCKLHLTVYKDWNNMKNIPSIKDKNSGLNLFFFSFLFSFFFWFSFPSSIFRTRIRDRVTRSCYHTLVTSDDTVTSHMMYGRI